MSHTSRLNLASRQFKADPYPFYARLRAEAPVYRTILPNRQPAWLITRYDDALAVLKDERQVKDRRNALNLIGNAVLTLMEHPEQRELLRQNPALN